MATISRGREVDEHLPPAGSLVSWTRSNDITGIRHVGVITRTISDGHSAQAYFVSSWRCYLATVYASDITDHKLQVLLVMPISG